VRRAGLGGRRPSVPGSLAVAVLGFAAAGAVTGIALLARSRSEQRLSQQAAFSPEAKRPTAPPPEDAPDPVLDRLLAAAQAPDASLVALDAAAHALLVRERFEEADALVLRALAAFPKEAEAVIHRAVLRGVAGQTAAARAELAALAAGPAGWEASLFSAGFALREGDEAAALRALRRVVAEAPRAEVTPALQQEVARLVARLGPAPAQKLP
jgi:hypothetical protein